MDENSTVWKRIWSLKIPQKNQNLYLESTIRLLTNEGAAVFAKSECITTLSGM